MSYMTRPFDPSDQFPFDDPDSTGPSFFEDEAPLGASPPRPPEPPDPPRSSRPAGDRSDACGDEDDEGDEDWERVRESRRERKERVLHTRISDQLADDIRKVADDLRVPVSNLVRNVLEEAFGAVERVSDEVGEFLEEVLGDAEGARGDLRRLRRRLHRVARRYQRRRRRSPAFDEPEDEADLDEERFEPRPARAPEDRVATEIREAPAPSRAAPQPPELAGEAPPPAGAPAAMRPRGADLPFDDVLGWQPLILNAASPCACGERQLARGESAHAGVTERGLSRTFLCETCMRARGAA
jgi:hypothetical protein